jgi:hypothetical protein
MYVCMNRTSTSGSVARNWPQDHRGGPYIEFKHFYTMETISDFQSITQYTSVKVKEMFRRIILLPHSESVSRPGTKLAWSFKQGTPLMLLSRLIYSSNLKMETIFRSEMSVDFQRCQNLWFHTSHNYLNSGHHPSSCLLFKYTTFRRLDSVSVSVQ